MPFAFPWTALVTMIAIFVYFWTGILVARARQRYNVKAPAITGNADFERVFRVQANTVEQMLQFLPCLWLFAVWLGDLWAAGIGAFWPVGRVVYAISYSKAAEKRALGFFLTVLPTMILALGAVVGILKRIL